MLHPLTCTVLQALLLALSSLPLSSSQGGVCDPFLDTDCTVTECLRCRNAPAACTSTPSVDQSSNISCVANITSCSMMTCDPTFQQVCGFEFINVINNDTLFFSDCHPFMNGTCNPGGLCRFEGNGFGGRLDCCCFDDDCVTGMEDTLVTPRQLMTGIYAYGRVREKLVCVGVVMCSRDSLCVSMKRHYTSYYSETPLKGHPLWAATLSIVATHLGPNCTTMH